jgi:CHASE2 domain-containing sensor protein
MSALFSKGEPGWGILGIGISVLGVFFLIFGVLRIVGYLHLKKKRFSGFILVFICEAFAFLGSLFSFIMGNFFMAAIPFIWSVIVLVYLIIERHSFFQDSGSEQGKINN